MRIREAFIAVTYRCNSKCSMCNIWKLDPGAEMTPADYHKIPPSLKTINITGGEPFLRHDLVEVIREIHSIVPSSRIVFSTNGFLTARITSTIKEIMHFHPRVGVGVSIDGIGKTHDTIRGIEGAYDKALTTVTALKNLGIRDLRIAMTIMRENSKEVRDVFALARGLDVEFTCVHVHNSDVYFCKDDNPTETSSGISDSNSIASVVEAQLHSKHAKDWLRAYHTNGIIDVGERHRYTSSCEAGKEYVFIAPNGDVYPCNVMNKKLGNITQHRSWDEFAANIDEYDLRKAVTNCNMDCWMVCNTRSLIKAHPFRVGSWILKRRFFPPSESKPL
ncbi:MAG: radical SAM protein [Candidatus Thermoplasmatota archaeon]